MGSAFLAGLTGGFAQSMQAAQQRQSEQQYKKALIEQSKLQTKILENKLTLADQEQGLMKAYLQTKGIQLLPAPAPSQPAAAPAPQTQGLLGKIFNPQQKATMQPAAEAQQTPLPQMVAQAQMQGQMPQAQGQPNNAFMEDVMGKKLFDLPPWREKLQAEQDVKKGQVYKYLDMGVGYVPMSNENKVIGPMIPKAPSYQSYETESPTGAKGRTFYDPHAPLGTGGPGTVQTQPPGLKPADIGRFNMVMQAQSKLGDVNNMIFPDGKLDRSVIVKATVPGGGIGKGSQLYSKMYQMVDSALRLETGAQANATEIETKMREYWPRVIDTEDTIKQKLNDLKEYVDGAVKVGDPTGQIRQMRSGGLGPTPQLPGQSSKEWIENGIRYRINPQTGKKQRWVQ